MFCVVIVNIFHCIVYAEVCITIIYRDKQDGFWTFDIRVGTLDSEQVCLMKLTRKQKLIRTRGFFLDFLVVVGHLIIVSLQVLPFEFQTLNVEY